MADVSGQLAFPPIQTLIDRGNTRGRRGEQRLLQRDGEQIATALGVVHPSGFALRHFHGQERFERGFFFSGCYELAAERAPILKGALHFVGDVLLEAADHQPFVSKVLGFVLVRVRDGRCVQHVHQAGETAGAAIVGRGGKHDERVRTAREQLGETRPQRAGAAVRHVVRLVDDDHVPIRILQVGAVFGVLLQGVDGDDGFVVVVERIVVAGNVAPHPLDARRIEPRERNGEAIPELLLELRKHAFQHQHQNAPSTAASQQFAHQNASFQRLAQPHRIRDENTLTRLPQRLPRRFELVRHEVHRRGVANVDVLVVHHRRAQPAFHVQQAVREPRRSVRNERGSGRVQLHSAVEFAQEHGFPIAHDLRNAHAQHLVVPTGGHVHPPHHPLRIAHDHASTGRRRDGCGIAGGQRESLRLWRRGSGPHGRLGSHVGATHHRQSLVFDHSYQPVAASTYSLTNSRFSMDPSNRSCIGTWPSNEGCGSLSQSFSSVSSPNSAKSAIRIPIR